MDCVTSKADDLLVLTAIQLRTQCGFLCLGNRSRPMRSQYLISVGSSIEINEVFFMLKWTVCSQERMLQLDMHSNMIHLALRAEDAVETAILSCVTFSLQRVYFPSAPPLSP